MDKKREQLEAYIEGHLLRRKYADKTRESYAYWVMRMADFFGKYEASEFTISDIEDFIRDMEDRQSLSSSTIKQAANALHFYFNTLEKKEYEVRGLREKQVKRIPKYVPTQKEILDILSLIRSKRTKLVVALIYSSGLNLEEAISLKITDIDFERNSLRVPLKKGQGARHVILADCVKPELYSYIRENNPTKWIFEINNGNRVNPSTIQKAITKATKKLGISQQITSKSLRYAYVKHLETLGLHLLDILDELGMSHQSSFAYYARLNQKKERINISPIDRRVPTAKQITRVKEEDCYVSESRINELAEIEHSKYDLTKLIELLHELNIANNHQMYIVVAMIVRSILDHIPPILECSTFSEVTNNYQSGRSFKKSMLHLQNSLRNVADSFLHQQIRKSEVLPTFSQIDFRADLDVLLAEIVRSKK